MRIFVLAFLLLCAFPAFSAEKLVTESFEITIDVRCEEGVVGCDNVKYVGVSKKTGASITLIGAEMHTKCADGVTPCRFLGYLFKKGKVTYTVTENGYLSVKQGNKVLVQEQGVWK